MTRRRIAQFISTIFVLFSVFFYMPTRCEAADGLSLTDIIGERFKTRTIDFAPDMNKTEAGVEGYTLTENGLELSSAVKNGSWILATNPAPMGNPGDAMEMRIKTSGQGFQIIGYDATGGRVYTKLQTGENGCWFNIDGSAIYKTTDEVFNKWITLLFVNRAEGFDMYYKEDGAVLYGEPFFSGTSKRSGTGNTVGIFANNNGENYIDYIKIYQQDENGSQGEESQENEFSLDELLGEHSTRQTVDFAPDMAPVSGLPTGHTITENGLEIGPSAASGLSNWNWSVTTPLDKEKSAVEMLVKTEKGFMYVVNSSDGTRAYGGITDVQNASFLNYTTESGEHKAQYVNAPADMLGQWINLLVVDDADGFSVYYKRKNAEKYKLFVSVKGKRTGSNDGVCLLNSTAMTYVDWIKIYQPGTPTSGVLTDPEIIAAQKNKIWYEDDFSGSGNDNWKLSGYSIEAGELRVDIGDNDELASAKLDLSAYDLEGSWSVRFKGKISGGKIGGNLAYGGYRVNFAIEPTLLYGNGAFGLNKPIGTDEWNEFLFCFNGVESVNMYYRKVGALLWELAIANVGLTSYGANEVSFAVSAAGTSFAIDDIKVYSGSLISHDEPRVLGNLLSVKANVDFSGEKDRRAMILGVLYDKERGYTKKIYQQDYVVPVGNSMTLSKEFDITGIDLTKNEITSMLWDSYDTGIALTESRGYAAPVDTEKSPEPGQRIGLKYETAYNEVHIFGYAGASGYATAVLFDSANEPKAVAQSKVSDKGMVDMKIAVDPDCRSGEYTLRLQYGLNAPTDEIVMLHCGDIPYTTIESAAAFADFLKEYGNEADKEYCESEGFAEDAYKRFSELTAGGSTDFYTFRENIEKAVSAAVKSKNVLDEINSAAAENRWAVLEKLLMTIHREYLGINSDALNGISKTKDVFLRLGGKTYADCAEVVSELSKAITEERKLQVVVGGGISGGSGGGKGAVAVGSELVSEINEKPHVQEEKKAFTDIESVPWATEEINKLQRYGILDGSGNGEFYPNRMITREEFLKLAMQTAGITAQDNSKLEFEDVDPNAWYYGYVATAYKCGIINGSSAKRFGIGESITRTDMAVILNRILDYCKIDIVQTRTAFVFDDFAQIPEYARNSVTKLCEASLLQGAGDNKFMPAANTSRAEAAVAVYRVYEYIREKGVKK